MTDDADRAQRRREIDDTAAYRAQAAKRAARLARSRDLLLAFVLGACAVWAYYRWF